MLRSRVVGLLATMSLALGGVLASAPPPAAALSPDLPFSADALPTWQTNGVVWEMAASRGRIVVGGSFTQIRPGAGQTGTAQNVAGLAIFDAATGEPSSCQLPAGFNGGATAVYAVDTAPDGNTVFVGGTFTTIGGTSVARLAEIDVVSCRVTSFRVSSISSAVLSIDVVDDAVYIGGLFQTVAGQQRRSFAKLSRTGALQSWTANASGATETAYSQTVVPDKNSRGDAIQVSPDGGAVAIGGDFFSVNGTPTHSFAVVDSQAGSVVQGWPASTVGNTSRTKMIKSDGERFYVAQEGFNGYDGTLAYNWGTYTQAWRDNCAGATQAVLPYDGVLFEAHHHHDCSSMGMFPDGRRTYLSATHAADPNQLHIGWLPELNDGTGEGLGPRTLAVGTASNGSDYLWVGGEFTRVNGQLQQGLTRFSATDTGAPPTPSVAARAVTSGGIQVNIRSVVDPDDSDLTYAVYRSNNTTTPIWTGTARSQHWYRPQLTFVDSSVTPGATYSYRVRATDASGNQSALSATVSAVATSSATPYTNAVLADSPRLYYRYDDPAGSVWVIDSSGATVQGLNGLAQNGVTRTAAGAISGDPSASATFSDSLASGLNQYIWNDVIARGPTTYSLETWFRTTSTTGGALINYGSSQGRPRSDTGLDRLSSTVDRVLYMEGSTGRLRFGVRSGSVQTVRSTAGYNDGRWHHVVAAQGPSGMRLYVDGVLVAQNNVTGNQSYYGTWHVGGDNLSGYPNTGSGATGRYFDGQLDETAVYYSALSGAQVASHFNPSGPDALAPSVPSNLASSVSGSDVGLSWSASTDNVGVTGYVVYRGSSADFTASSGNQIGQSSTTSFTDAGRSAGQWFYRVAARDAAGNVSSASAAVSATIEPPDTTAPSVPAALASSVSGPDVSLSWSTSTDNVGVTGYVVYRGSSADFVADAGSEIGRPGSTSSTDAGRPAGEWFYRVAARDAAGNVSAASAAVSATIAAPPAEPIVQTVVTDADTMVAAVNPAFVYGTSNQISARGDTAIWSFMRFQLPETPAGYELTGVSLRLVTSSDSTAASADTHQIHLVDGAWSEASTTWNNRPTDVASGVIGQLSGAASLSTAYPVTLAAAAFDGRDGDAVTLRLSTATGTDNVRISSREAGTATNRPALTLTYTPVGQ